MILKCANGTLSSVASIHVRGDTLEGGVFVPKSFLQIVGALVVGDVEIGGVSVFL